MDLLRKETEMGFDKGRATMADKRRIGGLTAKVNRLEARNGELESENGELRTLCGWMLDELSAAGWENVFCGDQVAEKARALGFAVKGAGDAATVPQAAL